GPDSRNMGELPCPELRGDFGLKDGIAAGGAATKMALRDLEDLETRTLEQGFPGIGQLQPVLQRTWRLPRNPQRFRRAGNRRCKVQKVPRFCRECSGAPRPNRIVREKMHEVFQIGRASRGGDEDAV